MEMNEKEKEKAKEFWKSHCAEPAYLIIPTELGDRIIAKCRHCKKKEEITDYDSW